jgi:hypothetical protein
MRPPISIPSIFVDGLVTARTLLRPLSVMLPVLVAAAALPPAAVAGVPAGAAVQRSNVAGLTNAQYMDAFVQRNGSRLSVAGRPFRFSGANVEFLGLENYGINSSKTVPAGSERYPSRYEVDDALATAHEMGATVVRAQTLGDTVGCAVCIEPRLGQFNQAAFAQAATGSTGSRRCSISRRRRSRLRARCTRRSSTGGTTPTSSRPAP